MQEKIIKPLPFKSRFFSGFFYVINIGRITSFQELTCQVYICCVLVSDQKELIGKPVRVRHYPRSCKLRQLFTPQATVSFCMGRR